MGTLDEFNLAIKYCFQHEFAFGKICLGKGRILPLHLMNSSELFILIVLLLGYDSQRNPFQFK